ncbi:MAG: hypothetical protein ACI8WB_002942, partial [Phenylobacterium sp.]
CQRKSVANKTRLATICNKLMATIHGCDEQ